jgi:hypothetical protein
MISEVLEVLLENMNPFYWIVEVTWRAGPTSKLKTPGTNATQNIIIYKMAFKFFKKTSKNSKVPKWPIGTVPNGQMTQCA